MQIRRLLALAAAVVLLLTAAASEASAAKRKAPQGFYGVTWDAGLNSRLDPQLNAQWDLMAASGVESVRTVFSWAEAQPVRLLGPRFGSFDKVVARAALRRIRLLPIVFDAPRWAQLQPGKRHSPPASPGEYAYFLALLAARYGSNGSFWYQHPELPRLPIRDWQVWNEPHDRFFWSVPDGWAESWPGGYVKLLQAVRPVLRQADPGARVVLGGLSGESWSRLRDLYNWNARKLFDVVAVHTYAKDVKEALTISRLTRKAMVRNKDRRKPLWITEVSWPAARGRTPITSGLLRFTTSESGMADRVKSIYAKLIKRRKDKRYKVGRVYWYTWASGYLAGTEAGIWDFSGLVHAGLFFREQAALGAYQASARRYEACTKTATGNCR